MINLELLFTIPGDAKKYVLAVQLADPAPARGSTWKCEVQSTPVTIGHVNPIEILGEGSWDAVKYAMGFVHTGLKALESHSGYHFYWPDGSEFDLNGLIFKPK